MKYENRKIALDLVVSKMKGSLILLVVLPLISVCVETAVVSSAFLPHNLYECDSSKTGVKVLQKIIHKSGRPNTIIHDAFQYPRVPDLLPSSIISCILVADLSRNGRGGYAEIAAGGINYNFVELIFESQAGQDIMFSVTIYANYTQGHAIFPS